MRLRSSYFVHMWQHMLVYGSPQWFQGGVGSHGCRHPWVVSPAALCSAALLGSRYCPLLGPASECPLETNKSWKRIKFWNLIFLFLMGGFYGFIHYWLRLGRRHDDSKAFMFTFFPEDLKTFGYLLKWLHAYQMSFPSKVIWCRPLAIMDQCTPRENKNLEKKQWNYWKINKCVIQGNA